MKVYNLGSLNIDHVYRVPHSVKPGETVSSTDYKIFPGGKGLNQSVALARAGIPVIHGGIIGTDGQFLADTLADNGVDISYIKKAFSPTGHAVIHVDDEGQNSIIIFSGTNHMFDTEYIGHVLKEAKSGDLLILQNEINGLREIFETAHKKGMKICFNPSPFDQSLLDLPLEYVGLWICNEIEGKALTGQTDAYRMIDKMKSLYPDSDVLITLGSDGAVFNCDGKNYFQPAVPCDVADTTAAGDTFEGFLIGMLISGKNAEQALRIAAVASSIAVSRNGASQSIPTLEEVMSR